jgi:hypothetical protein
MSFSIISISYNSAVNKKALRIIKWQTGSLKYIHEQAIPAQQALAMDLASTKTAFGLMPWGMLMS